MGRAIVTFGRSWQTLAIVRSLGRRGIEVYVGEEAPFAPAFFSKYCAGSFQHPSFRTEPEAFLDFMEEKVRALKPDGDEPYVLIPAHKETWLYARNRDRFEPHITLPLTSYENMARVHDKGNIPDLAEPLGIPIPPTHRFSSLEEVYDRAPRLEYPMFLKLREGAAGIGIRKVKTPEELTAGFREFVEGYGLSPEEYPLAQGFVDGDDYCVTALFDRGRCVARMTYRNIRAFPRETGAGALRETVAYPEAEAHAERLLASLGWHGIAELDFRGHPDGGAALIEVNPRFFGGLPQAVAANVDYPYLLYRIASGEPVEAPDVDYTARTESPVTGLLATLDEIAHDDEMLARLRTVRSELGALLHEDVASVKLRPFWDAVRTAASPKDISRYLAGMFEKHAGAIDDVLQRDDPLPALGFLYPIALMLRHGKLSIGVLAGEEELSAGRPRRRLRDLLARPRWSALLLTAALYGLAMILVAWEPTRSNVAWLLGWPMRLAEEAAAAGPDTAPLPAALGRAGLHVLNLAWLYLASALILRESPGDPRRKEMGKGDSRPS